jgi:hypothetical protein
LLLSAAMMIWCQVWVPVMRIARHCRDNCDRLP